jgi:superfamily II DNA or RNA helicase
MIEGNKAKGDSFEKLALAYFRTDPKFQNIKNVWHQRDIPYDVRSHLGLPTNDIGIDILLESVDGDYYPVQCKFHSDPNRAVGWKEASTFIGILNSNENFKAGYLSSNAFEVSSNYDKISGKPIVRLLGSIWDTVDPDPTAKTREALVPLTPRPHQERAISDAIEYFVKEGNSRGKLIFPCGAGKSLTGFWITQKLDAKSILVAVPSLALVKQTLEVYLREIAATQKNARWLCVCSDQEIGSTDEVKIHTSDLGVPCTTDPTEIRNWLQRPGEQQQIVFTTYQSGRLVADIAREENIAFDLAILDEAHKTVGSTGKLFSYLLFDQNIEIRKRIFMTATERFYSGSKDDIVSMDDPDVYGEVFTQMTFKEAINLELLTDYKVITIDVAKKEIADFVRENKLVELDSKWGKETEARSLAAMIALRKAMKALPIRNAVSFHSSIAKAERNDKLQKHITEAYKLPAIASYTVSGKMSTGQRDRIVNEFASKNGALITNARCLTEGVDVPNIDCIVFADPRKSRIDIVQALGRALRRKEGKDWGYVILPVVYDGDTHEIDNDNFSEIISIVRGLAANDERISEYFKDKNSLEKAGGGKLSEDQFKYLSETLDESEFKSQLGIKLWEGLSRFNWLPYDEARKFVHSLSLSSAKAYQKYVGGSAKNLRIPINPRGVYKNSGFISMPDFVGYDSYFTEFLSYEDAVVYLSDKTIKSVKSYRELLKSNPNLRLPHSPWKVYSENWDKASGWSGFLSKTKSPQELSKDFLNFSDARIYVHQLGFRTGEDWIFYTKSDRFPDFLPKAPQIVYHEFAGIEDWLGPTYLGRDERWKLKYLSFNEAKKIVAKEKFKNEEEFKNWSSRPENIPSKPRRVYQDEWQGIRDFIGADSYFQEFLDYDEARVHVQKIPIQSAKHYHRYLKEGSIKGLPTVPEKVYAKDWELNDGWYGFLGKEKIQYDFLNYYQLAYCCKQNGVTTKLQYSKWAKSINYSLNQKRIPSNPAVAYSANNLWQGWGKFRQDGILSS